MIGGSSKSGAGSYKRRAAGSLFVLLFTIPLSCQQAAARAYGGIEVKRKHNFRH